MPIVPESERIEFLLHRDGHAATRAWVERTAAIYRETLSHAPDTLYLSRFEQAIREFEEWLSANP